MLFLEDGTWVQLAPPLVTPLLTPLGHTETSPCLMHRALWGHMVCIMNPQALCDAVLYHILP